MRCGILPVVLLLLAACADGGAPAAPNPTPPSSPPASSGPTPRIGGCDIFPADNPWNRNVSGDPVDPTSDALIAAMSPDAAIHLDLGTSEEFYGIPYTVVPASQPLVPITYGTGGEDYSDESDPGPMPIPLNAPIEGAAPPTPTRPPATGTCSCSSRRAARCTSCTIPSGSAAAFGSARRRCGISR